MGGMGFIQSNGATLFYNNTMIDFNMIEASRKNGVKRFFYSSSACVYPETLQETTDDPSLKENTAWPAQPQVWYSSFVVYNLLHIVMINYYAWLGF